MRRLRQWFIKRRQLRDLNAALEIMRIARLKSLEDSGAGYWQARRITEYLDQNRRIAEMA